MFTVSRFKLICAITFTIGLPLFSLAMGNSVALADELPSRQEQADTAEEVSDASRTATPTDTPSKPTADSAAQKVAANSLSSRQQGYQPPNTGCPNATIGSGTR